MGQSCPYTDGRRRWAPPLQVTACTGTLGGSFSVEKHIGAAPGLGASDHHLGAALRRFHDYVLADTRRSAGHHRHLAVKPEFLHLLSPVLFRATIKTNDWHYCSCMA